MTMPILFTESELLEIIHGLDARANLCRGYSAKARSMRTREYEAGVAQGSEDASRRVQELIEAKRPVPALRLVKAAE